jgi:hypothetical protein
VLGGDRADDLASELSAVLLPLDLLVTQAEVHGIRPLYALADIGID